tara:strand:+ start:143 stop:265 length:123 start_codon:yes stop_codon:yes gene_type:complete
LSKAKELVILCGGKGTRLGEETKKAETISRNWRETISLAH